MRKPLLLLATIAIALAPMAARAEGDVEPVESEPFSCSLTMTSANHQPIQPCEAVALTPGEHAFDISWSAGAIATVLVEIAGDAGPLYELSCSIRAGISACEAQSSVAHDYRYASQDLLELAGIYQTTIDLPESAMLTFAVGPGPVHEGCAVACASVRAGVGTLSLQGV